jgi:hypothetical protein
MTTIVTRTETQTDGTAAKGSELTWSEVDTNFINLNDDKVEVSGAIVFHAKAAEALSKGDVVYVSGVSGNTPEVSKADADDASKMPAFGLAESDASLNAAVNVVTFGTIYELDTTAFSVGDNVYVSTTAGGLTATKPTGESSLIQNIGLVIRSHASAGSIKVGGAGRTNAVPNLNDGNVFIGNASNQAETRALVEADISDFGTYAALTDLSVTTNTAGTPALSYDNTTGVFSYTPPDLSALTETDTLDSVTDRGATTTNAITVGDLTADSASISGGFGSTGISLNSNGTILADGSITSGGIVYASGGNSANWNTAYGWGDHASAGYQTATTWTANSLLVSRSTGAPDTAGDSAGINAHYMSSSATNKPSGTDHSLLTLSYSAAWQTQIAQDWRNAGRMYIRGQNSGTWSGWSQVWSSADFANNSANWNTAYGWGNHASAGYLTFGGSGYNTYTTTADWNSNFIGTATGVTFRKTGWSYAGNADLTDAGNYTETAGSSFLKWSEGSRNTVLVIAPTTGGSANRVMVYNNQGSGYSPGWREIHTDKNACVAPSFQPTNAGTLRGVTGQYGSIEVDGGATGGYEGYSIGGRVVFMHNNSTTTGIYNDVNNQWLFQAVHNGESRMYHAGSKKGYTYSSGFRVTGNLLASSDVYAYYSDERLKDKTGKIENALDKVDAIETFYYTHNDIANELGYEGKERQVGVSAQSVAAVMPEVVRLAPIDDDGEGNSVTGENYQTVNYQRLVPLLLEAIKELRTEVEALKGDR